MTRLAGFKYYSLYDRCVLCQEWVEKGKPCSTHPWLKTRKTARTNKVEHHRY